MHVYASHYALLLVLTDSQQEQPSKADTIKEIAAVTQKAIPKLASGEVGMHGLAYATPLRAPYVTLHECWLDSRLSLLVPSHLICDRDYVLHRLTFLSFLLSPCVRCIMSALLGVLGGFLVSRTLLSIKISELNGTVVKNIVERDWKAVSVWAVCVCFRAMYA